LSTTEKGHYRRQPREGTTLNTSPRPESTPVSYNVHENQGTALNWDDGKEKTGEKSRKEIDRKGHGARPREEKGPRRGELPGITRRRLSILLTAGKDATNQPGSRRKKKISDQGKEH